MKKTSIFVLCFLVLCSVNTLASLDLAVGVNLAQLSVAASPVFPCMASPADLNADCEVDLSDLVILAGQWLGSCSGCYADIDQTNGIDLADFSLLANQWGQPPKTVVINEFLASSSTTEPSEPWQILDEDGDSSDWIEIRNLSVSAVSLNGWSLTDDADVPQKWLFPNITIPAEGYRIVFASGKDRTDPTGELHTNFQLDKDGEYLALIRPDGAVEHDYHPRYPSQTTNVSYGLMATSESDRYQQGYFQTPTPGDDNGTGVVGAIEEDVDFSIPGGIVASAFALTLSHSIPTADIYYTLDGTEPTAVSTRYTAPISINTSTCVRARAIEPGKIAGPVKSESYIVIDADALSFSSDIPVMVIDDFGQGALGDFNILTTDPFKSSIVAVFDRAADGRARFTEEPAVYSRGGARVRGTSSSGYPKQGLAVEFWDEQNKDKDVAMLGMPADSDWVLYAPYYFDRSLVRNAFIYELSNQAGRYAPRTRFVELFINTDGGALDSGDYMGVYVLLEKIKRGDKRVDVEKLGPADDGEPEVSGGYVVKNDWLEPGEDAYPASPYGWHTTSGWPTSQGGAGYLYSGLSMVDPQPEEMTAEQFDYIKDYFQAFDDAVRGISGEHFSRYIDVDSWVDHNILNMFSKNVDALRLSAYMYKSRDGKLCAGPIWDFDRSMDSYDGRDDAYNTWKGTGDGTDYFSHDWWGPLFQDDDFRLRYADHWFAFREDVMTSANIDAMIDSMAAELQEAQQRNFARWPEIAPSSWPGEINHLKDWLTHRINWIDNQMAIEFAPAPPTILLNGAAANAGGNASVGDAVTFSSPSGGSIYYTLDGTDPRSSQLDEGNAQETILVDEDASKKVLVPSVANGGDALYQFAAPFNVTLYKANTSVSGMDIANEVITNPVYQQSVYTEPSSVINYLDGGGDGHYTANNIFPGLSAGEQADDYVVVVTGSVEIEQAGWWTFGVSSDDGFSCVLSNDSDSYAFSFPDPRAAADTLYQVNIAQAGLYRVRLVYYENGGGAELEFFAAQGNYTTFDSNAFHLVGDTANGGLSTYGTWLDPSFDDSAWIQGTGGVGFERYPSDPVNYSDLISIDVFSEMFNKTGSCYIRIPFAVENIDDMHQLLLDVRYDDGYIAYLNGCKVYEVNADDVVSPAWNSLASAFHDDSAARDLETADISAFLSKLKTGTNVLAFHLLNQSTTSSDVLLSARLRCMSTAGNMPSPSALVYSAPVSLNESIEIQARSLNNGVWSALNEATYAVGPVTENLRVTELMYHPADPNTEFIELKNTGTEPINLNRVRFTNGVDFTFPSLELAGGQYTLLVQNVTAFTARYGAGFNIAGQYTGGLDNDGEKIALQDAIGTVIHSFDYHDSWYDITDGQGFSLTIKNPDSTDPNLWDDKAGWRPSAVVGGSPGQSDSGMIPAIGDVVINEVLAHSDTIAYDWIELYNTTDQPINIGGWFLSDNNNDDPNRMKYQIAEGTVIPDHGYKVFYENLHFGNSSDPGCSKPFQLSENGETLYLQSGAGGVLTGYYEEENFGASERDVAFGRYQKSTGGVNFVAMSTNTPGTANAYPKVGPVVITEIMYHPQTDSDAEYIELQNISSSPVTLYDASTDEPWRFVDDADDPGLEFYFPTTPVIMTAGQTILLIKNAAAFKSEYGADSLDGITYFEWLTGSLSNDSEKPELQMPGDVDESGKRLYIRADRVSYDDDAPWPVGADGTGQSLHHKTPMLTGQNYSNDPANWYSAAPTPGWSD